MNDGNREVDAFISHSSAQKAWVEALANNLVSAGRSVFFDRWHLVPGAGYIGGLHDGIARSRAMVLVVSPEAYHSGWVKRELDTALIRSIKEPDFVVIPVVYGGLDAAMPFTESIHWVDFRPPVPYREAFARLLAGIDRRAPGPNPYYRDPLQEPAEATGSGPAAGAAPPVSAVLKKLGSSQIVMLLTRDGQNPADATHRLATAAADRYPPDRIRRLSLPWMAEGGDPAPFYRDLARQVGMGVGVASADAFHEAFRDLLASGRWLWLVSGVENAAARERTALAREIRGRTEVNREAAFVLCGEEKLHALRFAEGDHSVFSNADAVFWPEVTEAGLDGLLPDGVTIDADARATLLAATGGHPALIREVAEAAADGGDWSEPSLDAIVRHSQTVWRALVPLLETPATRTALRRLVREEVVGEGRPYLFDPLLRRLFWSNLVREQRKAGVPWLHWRSPSVRSAVEDALQAKEAAL